MGRLPIWRIGVESHDVDEMFNMINLVDNHPIVGEKETLAERC
jgi:hypothetical protein